VTWARCSAMRCAVVAIAMAASPEVIVADEAPTGAVDYRDELPRIAQTAPADAPATMVVRPGFAVDLAVAEPMLASPVAIAWDEDGRLYVAEMRGYSEDQGERLGRIRLLHDDNADGTYDRATVYADGLAWPTALIVWNGGLFVGDAPDIVWLKDTDGDGVADERRKMFTGFGTSNVQGLFNSFAFDVDGRIHGAGSSTGGEIRRVGENGEPVGNAVSINGRDFSFDPRSFDFRPETGGAQHGRSTDDAGHVYLCHNSDHAIRVMVDDRSLARNPFFPAPAAKESIAVEGPQAAVYRSSPVEPWRVLRTRLRASGIVPGMVEGGGRPAGYFTSATGITVVRGDAVGDLAGMLVVGDVGSNLVHRKKLLPSGAGVRAERIDEECELVASTDVWFRPVQFANGPDGALWIIDMQREVIEHPASLAPPIKKHLDLTSGRDTGRLWRLVAVPEGAPDDAAAATRKAAPRLSQAPTATLIQLLGDPNGWHRDTARRLLVERNDPDAVPLLHEVARKAASPLAQTYAAHVLSALGLLEAADILPMLASRDSIVRAAAATLAERLLPADAPPPAELVKALADLSASEPQASVRLPLALVAGALPVEPRLAILRTLLERDGADPWVRYAAFTSLRGDAAVIVSEWLDSPQSMASKGAAAALPGLVTQVGRKANAAELSRIVAGIDRLAVAPAAGATDTRPTATVLLGELSSALSATGSDVTTVEPVATTRALVKRLGTYNREVALDRKADVAERLRAMRGLSNPADLEKLLVAEEPTELVTAAIEVLDRSRDPVIGGMLVTAIPRLSVEARQAAAVALSHDAARALEFLGAIEAGSFAASDLDRQTAAALWAFPERSVAGRAAEVLGAPPPADRESLVVAYRASLPATGSVEAGRAIFRKQCVGCHRVEGEGRETGPALAAVQARGPEAMLLSILDPNREVLPVYHAHTAVDANGRVVTGVVTAQSEGSVTLRTADGVDVTFPRADLESFVNTKRSLMPEGFEKTIDARGMADLIAYLMQAK
jgi:putative membrane-bound dehydrogenase-like protein